MGLKTFAINLAELSKISSLLLTTRVRKYQKNNNSGFSPFLYFIDNKNKYSLGQLKKEDYQTNGKFPIIDQGKEFIVGYSNESDLVYTGKFPLIIFGDHTRIFKYVNFPFIQGADGIKVIKPNEDIVNPKFFYYLLSKVSVPSRGYNRHFSILKKQKYPLISKSIQNKIVDQIEPIEKKIKKLRAQIKEHREIINKVFAREFGFDLETFEELKKEKFFEVDFSKIGKYGSLRYDVKNQKYMDIFNNIISNCNYFTLKKISTETSMYGANEAATDGKKGINTRYIRITDIDEIGNLTDNDWKTAEKVDEQYLLKDDDFLFARSGNTVGKTFLYDSKKHEEAIFAGYFIKYNLDFSDLNKEFFHYYTKSFIYDFWINGIIRIKGQPNINANEYLELRIPYIDKTKQQKIVDEIKAELDKQEEIKQNIKTERNKIDEIIEKAIT